MDAPTVPAAGLPLLLLRLGGLATAAGAVIAYDVADGSWSLCALMFLLPDVAMLGYLIGPRTGALAYNLAHTYLLPALLAGAGLASRSEAMVAAALVRVAHVGFDWALGYGLRYANGFTPMHLGTIGGVKRWSCCGRRPGNLAMCFHVRRVRAHQMMPAGSAGSGASP